MATLWTLIPTLAHARRSRVKMGVEDPDLPKPPPSALRKVDPRNWL